MNILFITPSYFPHRGGTEQVIFELSNLLSKSNNSIVILTQKRDKSMKYFEEINNIKVYRIRPLPHYLGNLLHFRLKQVQLYLKAIKLNRKYKFDIIHNFHVYEYSIAVRNLQKKLKLPLLTSLMGWDTFDPVIKIPKNHLKYVSTVMNISDRITSPSNQLAEIAKSEQGCKKQIRVIPHGTNMNKGNIGNEIDIRDRYNISNDKKVFISVQRIHHRKGLKYLIEAIPELAKENENIHFLIVGRGPEETLLKDMVTDLDLDKFITWAGFVKDEELPYYYNSSDFFILPSLYEAFGLVYVDALSFGLPVITTINGGTLDIISDKNGILFNKDSTKEVICAIRKALQKKWNRKLIIEDAKKYQWKNIISEYMDEYSKLIGK